jgi:plastocyanin
MKKNMNTTEKISRWMGWTAGVILIWASAFSGSAASVTVFVGNTNLSGFAADVFVPPSTNINVNDSVIWVWEGLSHSTTSGTNGIHGDDNGVPSGLWDSGVTSAPHAFTNTFTSSGDFSYYCTIHVSFGMSGHIIVAGGALPPTVSITNPPDGTTLAAPASFALAATASGSSAITNVQFFQGAASLGNVTTAPYSVPVNSLAAADYAFSAVASDNTGLTATNAITVHVVTPVATLLTAPQFLPPADFRFNYTANPGLTYIVQRTSSLSSGSWTTLSTNVAGSNPVLFDDPAAAGNPGFYRVGRLPNP